MIRLFYFNKIKPIFRSFISKNNDKEKNLSSLTSICNKNQKTTNTKGKQLILLKKLLNIYTNSQKIKAIKGKYSKSSICISPKVNNVKTISYGDLESVVKIQDL